MRRRRDRAWIACVGTRLYLLRGDDESHVLELLYERRVAFHPDDVRIRPARRADLELVDMTGGEQRELARWSAAVRKHEP